MRPFGHLSSSIQAGGRGGRNQSDGLKRLVSVYLLFNNTDIRENAKFVTKPVRSFFKRTSCTRQMLHNYFCPESVQSFLLNPAWCCEICTNFWCYRACWTGGPYQGYSGRAFTSPALVGLYRALEAWCRWPTLWSPAAGPHPPPGQTLAARGRGEREEGRGGSLLATSDQQAEVEGREECNSQESEE